MLLGGYYWGLELRLSGTTAITMETTSAVLTGSTRLQSE